MEAVYLIENFNEAACIKYAVSVLAASKRRDAETRLGSFVNMRASGAKNDSAKRYAKALENDIKKCNDMVKKLDAIKDKKELISANEDREPILIGIDKDGRLFNKNRN